MLLTRSPLEHPLKGPPFDLHVLSTPPAFVLSQDQTLHEKHRNQTVSKQFSSQRTKPDQNPQKNTLANKNIQKLLTTNKTVGIKQSLSHTIEFSKNTPNHQPQQPANFSEPCSILVRHLSGQTPQPTRVDFRFANRGSSVLVITVGWTLPTTAECKTLVSQTAKPAGFWLDSGAVAIGDASTKLHRR